MKPGTVIPYLRKIQKIHKSRDMSLELCWDQHFFTRNCQILLHQEMQIQIGFWYINCNSFNFSGVFIIVLINMVTILLISAKMAPPVLLTIKVFWNKGYDVIISVHKVTNKFLSRDSNYIVNPVMWPKCSNYSISMRKVIITSLL